MRKHSNSVQEYDQFSPRWVASQAIGMGTTAPVPTGWNKNEITPRAKAIRLTHRHVLGLCQTGLGTPARLSQIMNLLLLAPDIQEAILFLEPAARGRDRIKERDLRPIAVVPDWQKQRRLIGALR